MNINLRINVKKLDKTRFVENSYTKRDGTAVNEVNADLVLIEKKEPRVIKEGDTWTLKETHFIVEKRAKDESTNIVGSGTQFVDKVSVVDDSTPNMPMYDKDIIDEDQIPF